MTLKVCAFVLAISIGAGCASNQLAKETVVRMLEQRENASAMSSMNHVSSNSVTFGIPRAIYLDPDVNPQTKRLNEANLDFYRLLAAKGFIRQEPQCKVAPNQFTPHRQFYCFTGTHVDFVTGTSTGDPASDYIWVVIARPFFDVGSIAISKNAADVPVEIKHNPSTSYQFCMSLVAQMDAKYSDVKDVYGHDGTTWANWRSPLTQEQSRPIRKTYYFEKFGTEWRIHDM